MSSQNQTKDRSGADFDDSRREQLRQAQEMSLRRRLEALDQLAQLSDRLQAMPKHYPMSQGTAGADLSVRPAPASNDNPGDHRINRR